METKGLAQGMKVLIVVMIFLFVILVFPTFDLAFSEFTVVYWGFSVASFLLNQQARRWTHYLVNHRSLRMEENPVMRKTHVKTNSKHYWISWLIMCIILSFLYIVGATTGIFLPFLFLPSWLLAFVVYGFLNDLSLLRRIKKQGSGRLGS